MNTIIAIKAADGAWILNVLGVPFGSPQNKDAHGEYFSQKTNFHAEKIPLPPVVYYHGFTPEGRPQSAPEFIGRTTERRVDDQGVWYRVVLDQGSKFARRVWDAAQRGAARASSGTMAHLKRSEPDGHITHWLVSELSIFDVSGKRQPANRYAVALPATKAIYKQAGLPLPQEVISMDPEEQNNTSPQQGEAYMLTKESINELIRESHEAGRESAPRIPEPLSKDALKSVIASALDTSNRPISVTPQDLRGYVQQERDAIKAEIEEQLRTEWAVSNRLPMGGAPSVLKMTELRKWDHTPPEDMAIIVGVLDAPHAGPRRMGASPAAVKALAIKLEEDKSETLEPTRREMKAAGIKSATKADEVIYTTNTGYGSNWIGHAYSMVLWENIRMQTFVVDLLPKQQVPMGYNAMTFPLEGADPTWYRVPETNDTNYNTTGSINRLNATVPATGAGTGSTDLGLKKAGARTLFTGEMTEDSIIPVAAQLRKQLAESGAENLEHMIIDGDTTLSSDNINSVGTPSTQPYTMFNGMRHLALVTSSATNARSGGGGNLTSSDFIDTAKLLGAAGIAAADPTKSAFIIPLSLHWLILQLSEVLTREKIANPTIESGMLKAIYGMPVYTSAQMLKTSTGRLTKADGTIDDSTQSNNIVTQLLCIRADRWVLGRRMDISIETNRIPESDSTQIVALMRVGLVYQNALTAAAVSYNIGNAAS